MNTLSLSDLRKAVQIKEEIAQLEQKLASLLGSVVSATRAVVTAALKPGKRRKMSAAGRARIIAAQKARWAKIKGKPAAKTSAPGKKKTGMSAASKAKLSALMKQRWAARKKAGKSRLG